MSRPRAKTTPIRAWRDTPRDGSVRVTELRTVRDDPACVWVVLGGTRAGVLHRAVIARVGLVVDMAWTQEIAERIEAEVRNRLCDRSAVRLLAARMRSRVELVRALTRQGHDAATASACAARHAEQGAINDDRYAEIVLRNELARKPAGRRLLEAKLRARGVGDAAARPAVVRALADRDEMADARKALGSASRSMLRSHQPDVVRRRLLGRLTRRGFSSGVCRKTVDDLMREAAS